MGFQLAAILMLSLGTDRSVYDLNQEDLDAIGTCRDPDSVSEASTLRGTPSDPFADGHDQDVRRGDTCGFRPCSGV